jgi:hypothetical protein
MNSLKKPQDGSFKEIFNLEGATNEKPAEEAKSGGLSLLSNLISK